MFKKIIIFFKRNFGKKDIKITISSDLVMSREETKKSSFSGPSGAYLTWLEMFGDNSFKGEIEK
jgi:hypothetical protein